MFYPVLAVSLFNIWEYVLRGLQYCLKWIIEKILDPVFDGIVSSISGLLPSMNIDFTSVISPEVYALLNDWFPCDYAITCFVAWVGIACVVWLLNWILGLIPTVS